MSDVENPLDEVRDLQGNAPGWLWKSVGTVAGVAGAVVARSLINRARSRVHERDGGPRRTSLPETVLWTVAIGVAGTLGRLVALRVVANVWVRRTDARERA